MAFKKIPESVLYEKALLTCCGLGPSFGAFEQMNLSAFDTVLITGLRSVGIGAVINVKFSGARVIVVESYEYTSKLAKEIGAELVVNPQNENAV